MNGSTSKYFFMIIFVFYQISLSQTKMDPLILQEMSWVDVKEYLKSNDMVIIPIGSTEQHGPHLPLGTDYYTALEMSKMISEQTGVIVAPILMVGYSVYHSGFQGTLSLKPETMEQVIFECVEMLIMQGFNRILIYNGHGGNNIVQDNLVHRINHTTEAIAFTIGVGSPLQKSENGDFFDWHAGKKETSNMLSLMPQLVRMDRAEKPDIRFTPQMNELKKLSEKYPELLLVWDGLFGVPSETKKGGASHEISSNGIWSLSDPKSATEKMGRDNISKIIEKIVKFIEAWKLTKN